jgi:putative DNA primase/helicase
MAERRPIDFAGLAAALLERAHTLVPQWLSHGVERNGRWYVGDFDGGDGESANVSLTTGTWIDNAGGGDDRGGDLISLYARIRGLNNGEAARELMRDMGWMPAEDYRPVQTPAQTAPPPWTDEPPPALPESAEAPAARPPASVKRVARWQAVVPVPTHAPVPEFKFGYKDAKQGGAWVELDAVRTWAYRLDDQLFGYVARFERVSSDGELVKDTVPRTWCTNLEDGRGSQRWHWKSWEAPRPLYVPAETMAVDKPVVVVEGEKCALAGHELLGDEFQFVCWPGGCKTWALADWSWLNGRQVVLWPDCDAQRERLSRAEREAGADRLAKPLLPEHKQPGMQAMVHIGSKLLSDHGCTVRMCKIPAPGNVGDGWDIADAIAQGWTVDQVRGFIEAAQPFQAPSDEARAKGISTPSRAAAGDGFDAPAASWRAKLLETAQGAIKPARENVVLAVDGMPLPDGGWLPGVPEAAGVIAFNDFTNDVLKLKPTPWGTAAGVWDESDELEMGDWLSRVHWLPPMSRQTLEEAVSMVARRHRYHPARERFMTLQGKWDKVQRLRTWLLRCCRQDGVLQDGEAEADRDARLHDLADHDMLGQYLARVGRWVLMAICQRVLQPGCKFDYMLILEGGQGMGKSTLARILGGEWFADTGLMLGDKDSYQNLQGVLVYEWGELDSLNRAEVQKVKQFISSQKDRFRASFDRRPKDYPRQVVFIGTTNESHYLTDPTGNRRFWPVRVQRPIDLAWLRENLEQLYAEALHYVQAGERFHPNLREQNDLFDPQQTERTVENALESAIRRYLYDESQKPTVGGLNGSLVNEVTLCDLLGALGVSVDKQTNVMTKQASAALGRLGWERGRASGRGGKVRPWVYRRPGDDTAGTSPRGSSGSTQPASGQQLEGAPDDCPF